MISHQIANSLCENYEGMLYLGKGWEMHLHRSFEFITVFSGKVLVTVGAEKYELSSGECLLVPPFVTHAISAEPTSLFFIAVFSGDYVEEVAGLFKSKRADYHKFTLTDTTKEYVLSNLCPTRASLGEQSIKLPTPKRFLLRSCLYAICSEFLNGATLVPNKKEDALILDMLSYIEAHYLEDITLKDMARTLGYTHEYASRVFNRTLGLSFKSLVNQYRIEYALSLMRTSSDSLVSVAMASGFQSLRSFNRICRDLLGSAPSEIKKGNRREK